jgi:serine/threonine protein kinase
VAEVLGNYELLEVLRERGPSRFYRARNGILGNEVMVRRLTVDPARGDDVRTTFFREMRHAASLRHPQFLRPVDVFEANGFLWSVSEVRIGSSTTDLVEQKGPLSLVDATQWGGQVGDGLAYLHGRGFLSGRVSPQWVFVDAEGPLLVSLTKSADLAGGLWPLRPAVQGLSPFSAPEELSGERPTARSDVYSLAATVVWWLTQTHPYGGSTPDEAIARATGGGPLADLAGILPDVPEEVVSALRAALHRDPASRAGSAASLSAVLLDTHRSLLAEVPRGFAPGDRLAADGQPDGIEIVQRHGAGSFGVVMRARPKGRSGSGSFAVKTLKTEHRSNAEVRQRFVREARVLQGVSHRNVVSISAVGEQDGMPFVVMEFVDGPDLGTLLLREGALAADRAARIAAGIARGIGAIHAQGIVHRDLKPHNVLLAEGDRPVIADFGLAREVASPRMTLTGAVLGTPAYMAPEQARGVDTGFAVDVYALGAITYEMLAGRPPFSGRDPLTLVQSILTATPEPLPPEVPPPLQSVVERLLAKDPDDRPASVEQVASVLEKIADHFVCPEHALASCAAGPELETTRSRSGSSGVGVAGSPARDAARA